MRARAAPLRHTIEADVLSVSPEGSGPAVAARRAATQAEASP